MWCETLLMIIQFLLQLLYFKVRIPLMNYIQACFLAFVSARCYWCKRSILFEQFKSFEAIWCLPIQIALVRSRMNTKMNNPDNGVTDDGHIVPFTLMRLNFILVHNVGYDRLITWSTCRDCLQSIWLLNRLMVFDETK